MGLTLTVLGCSGSYPGPDSACSGYLVQGGGVNVVLDMGPGTLANLQRHIALGDVDAVVLSHAHADHWVDLTGLHTAWTYTLGRTGLPVYGTTETLEKANCLMGDVAPTIDWTSLDDGDTARIGGLDLNFSATDHYVETLAVRVACEGSSLAYSADTGPSWSFSELGTDIGLALCEATNLEADEGEGVLHLSARQAGVMARAAGVERLVLTHLLPGGSREAYRSEGEAAFGRALDVASVHARYDV